MKLVRLNTWAIVLSAVLVLSGCRKEDNNPCELQIIKVAALHSETGGLSYLGITSTEAVQIAVEEMNHDFEERHLPYRFEFSVFDTQITPSLAVQAMQTIGSSGIKLVIGPQTSAEALAIKSIADSLGILFVSQSSTAGSLAFPGDMLFRYAPGEQILGQAMANTFVNSGKQVLITLSRNDAGSLGLSNAVSQHMVANGASVVSVGAYDLGTTDFSSYLSAINTQIQTLSATYPIESIGVLVTSFDETITLFNEAAAYPSLSTVQWYGGVGFYKNQALLTNPTAVQFAATTHFFSPGFSMPQSTQSLWSSLLSQIQSRTGVAGDAYAMCAYDAVKVMGEMIENNNGLPNSASWLQSAFMSASNAHYGVTGPIMIDANGDRANGTFDYWGVSNTGSSYQWIYVGSSE